MTADDRGSLLYNYCYPKINALSPIVQTRNTLNFILTERISDRTIANAKGKSPLIVAAMLPDAKYGNSGLFSFRVRRNGAGSTSSSRIFSLPSLSFVTWVKVAGPFSNLAFNQWQQILSNCLMTSDYYNNFMNQKWCKVFFSHYFKSSTYDKRHITKTLK